MDWLIVKLAGATVWLVQQCEAGIRIPLLDKPDSGTLHGSPVLKAYLSSRDYN